MPGSGSPEGPPIGGEGGTGGGTWDGGYVIHEHGGPGPDWGGSGGGSVPSPGGSGGAGIPEWYLGNHLNTNTGNLLSVLPLVGWGAKGFQGVQFTLLHNSRANSGVGTYSEFGGYWSHSYNHRIWFDLSNPGPGDRGIVVWSDGLHMPFTYTSGSSYAPPAGVHATLNRYAGHCELETKDGWTYSFSMQFGGEEAVVTSIEDPFGNALTISRDPYMQRITSVTDGLGRALTISYDEFSRPSTLQGPDGQTWWFGFATPSGNPTSIAHSPSGNTIGNFDYASNRISQFTDPRSKIWTYEDDAEGKLTSAQTLLATSGATYTARTRWSLLIRNFTVQRISTQTAS